MIVCVGRSVLMIVCGGGRSVLMIVCMGRSVCNKTSRIIHTYIHVHVTCMCGCLCRVCVWVGVCICDQLYLSHVQTEPPLPAIVVTYSELFIVVVVLGA